MSLAARNCVLPGRAAGPVVTADLLPAMNRAMTAQLPSLLLLTCALAVGCSKSSSSSTAPPVLATQVIGPDGGVLLVESGSQQGLVLQVPAGAVSEPTAFQVTEVVPAPLPPGVAVVEAQPGQLFRIEPSDLILSTSATLRAPYNIDFVGQSAPGNVLLWQQSPVVQRSYDPNQVDVVDGWMECQVKTFGLFQVTQPDPLPVPAAYVPPVGTVSMFTGGVEFSIVDAVPAVPSASQPAVAWRLTGPFVDESVLFDGDLIVGRQAQQGSWRELWSQPYSPFEFPSLALASMQSMSMQVEAPIGTGTLGATVLPLGFRQFSEPMMFDGRLLLDVLKVTLNVSYNRADLGAGERQLAYWFAPGDGIVRVSIDGANYDRIP